MLYGYIVSRGDLYDPITRQKYRYHELMRLWRQCQIEHIPSMEELDSRFASVVISSALIDSLTNELIDALSTFIFTKFKDFKDASQTFEVTYIPLFVQIRENFSTIAHQTEIHQSVSIAVQFVNSRCRNPSLRTLICFTLRSMF
tara:strand:- start:231 stop:662 length:432 start_codon:yes stop_codon:yes gene_type:complete